MWSGAGAKLHSLKQQHFPELAACVCSISGEISPFCQCLFFFPKSGKCLLKAISYLHPYCIIAVAVMQKNRFVLSAVQSGD